MYHPEDNTSIYVGKESGHAIDDSRLLYNSFFGTSTGQATTDGSYNSFFGYDAGKANITGINNCFFGSGVGQDNTTGFNNSFFGLDAGASNTTGGSNCFFGIGSGFHITTQQNVIAIGALAGPTSEGMARSDRLYIDVERTDEPLIYGEFNNDLVRINGVLQLGPNTFAGGIGGDEGIIKSPRSAGSDIFVIANDGIQVRIGEVGTEEGTFEIFNGAANDRVFFIREDGFTEIDGDLEVTGTINGSSDINRKKNFQAVNASEVLSKISELEITEWQYKGSSDRHIGPMAQDFFAAFGLGQGETTIATVDADGVALAAIQALASENSKLLIENLQQEKGISNLKERLERLEVLILEK